MAVDAPLSRWSEAALVPYAGRRITLGVRAEDLSLERPAGAGIGKLRGRTVAVEPLGAETLVLVALDGETEITARLPRQVMVALDQELELFFRPEAAYLFDAESGLAIAPREDAAAVIGAAVQRRAH
jgi:multiple sugar transport system ATP-binding protein